MNYHLLHITYTTGVHAMYNTFRAYYIHTNMLFIVVEIDLIPSWPAKETLIY